MYKPDTSTIAQLFVMGEGLGHYPLNWSGPGEPWCRLPGLGGLQVPGYVAVLTLEEIPVTSSGLKMMGPHL